MAKKLFFVTRYDSRVVSWCAILLICICDLRCWWYLCIKNTEPGQRCHHIIDVILVHFADKFLLKERIHLWNVELFLLMEAQPCVEESWNSPEAFYVLYKQVWYFTVTCCFVSVLRRTLPPGYAASASDKTPSWTPNSWDSSLFHSHFPALAPSECDP